MLSTLVLVAPLAVLLVAHPEAGTSIDSSDAIDSTSDVASNTDSTIDEGPRIEAQGPPMTAELPTASEPEKSARRISPALTAGVLEAFALASAIPHLGFFVTMAVDLQIPVNDAWTMIPSFGFEFAPDVVNWGGTFFLIADRVVVSKPSVTVAVEPQIGFYQNAVPLDDGGFQHNFYVSPGFGIAFIFERFIVLPTLFASWGVQRDGWSLGPSLMFSVPI